MPLGTVADTLNQEEDYAGKFFLGLVFDNNDPEDADRIRATIPELYTEDNCPWIGPSKFSPFGQGPGFGMFGSPQKGSQVLIVLQEGNPKYPMYLGSLLFSKNKTSEQKREFHNEAWGFVDPSGNKFIVDMKTQTLTFVHSTQVSFVIKEGSVFVEAPNNHSWTLGGNATLKATGVVNISGSKIRLNNG